ncbi:MAG: ATP-dependent protease ATPase subunit HslU [bacterium]|nr:ATP-dependent protease ATPase subunit HslU [bacterium]
MEELTPRQIVEELDKYVVGQHDAKRAVAVAIRNRWRRQQLPESMRDEVGPKNIIMIGPTGVGKTEIARRLASLVNAPFVKVEATKYTEVGYHGRDVESMVRDLVDRAVHMVMSEQREVVRTEAERLTEEQLLDALMPPTDLQASGEDVTEAAAERRRRNREKLRTQLATGELDDRTVELTIEQKATPVGMFAAVGDQIDPEIQGFLERLIPSQSKSRRLPIHEARKVIFDQQCDTLIDREKAMEMALLRAENRGMIFIDELDKLCSMGGAHGPDISRQGVQRDLLPIVEGATVTTRHGQVKTDHVLCIAAGAFSRGSPNDLMPELQGRFPIRVELTDLTKDDFLRILTEPQNALTTQHIALMATEGVKVEYTEEAIEEVAVLAGEMNERAQNIGARRLHTIMEKLMENLSFEAPERRGESVRVDAAYVRERLEDVIRNEEAPHFGFRGRDAEDPKTG